MSASLYSVDILRLATDIPHLGRLDAPHATAERRSPVCGSEVRVDVRIDADGRISELGQEVRACALGQASAALMGRFAVGRSAAELAQVRDSLASFLAGETPEPSAYAELELFRTAIPHSARHASIRLAFETVAQAASEAERAVKAGAA